MLIQKLPLMSKILEGEVFDVIMELTKNQRITDTPHADTLLHRDRSGKLL